jgi:Tfp pilus assembly protein PilZ
MLQTSIERRVSTRVQYQQAVRVVPRGRDQIVDAQATNLSESGMYVTVAELEPFSVGMDLCCDVPLADTECHLAVQGRVAHLQAGPAPGIGVCFVDPSDEERARLRQAVAGGATLGSARPVKVWFQGLPQPSRAAAIATPSGVLLLSELPFLRLGSRVVLSFDDQSEGRSGLLRSAGLALDGGVPQLRLSVELEPMAAQTCTDWPPPPSALDSALTEEAVIDPADTSVYDIVVDDDIVVDLEAPSATTGSITAVELPSPPVADEPSVQAPELLPPPDTFCSAPPDPSAISHWDLGRPAVADEQPWELGALPPARPAPRSRHLGIWLVTLTMAGLTVASMAYTDLWSRVRDRLLPWVNGAAASIGAPSVERETLAPLFAPAPAEPPSVKPAAPASAGPGLSAAPVVEAQPPASAPTNGSAGERSAEPLVVRLRGQWTLVIPIHGSAKGLQHYQLANPNGLAINLPAAQPRVPFGDYSLQGGFRRVWVRRRGEGTHLRVFFATEMTASLEVERRLLRVTLLEGADK